MSVTSNFYRARAEEDALCAENALLDNVRNRALRSSAAWQAMADRLVRSESLRAKEVERKAITADDDGDDDEDSHDDDDV